MHREGLLRGAPRGSASGQLSSQMLRLACRVRPGVCPLDEAGSGVADVSAAEAAGPLCSSTPPHAGRRLLPSPAPAGYPPAQCWLRGACLEGRRGLPFPWLKTSSLRAWWLGRISAFSDESSFEEKPGYLLYKVLWIE